MNQENKQKFNIFGDTLRVINIGLKIFAEDLRSEGVEVVQVDWRPPAGGNNHLTAILANLNNDD
jgi:FdrA protein